MSLETLGQANPSSRNLGGGFGNCLSLGLMLLIEVNATDNTDFKGSSYPKGKSYRELGYFLCISVFTWRKDFIAAYLL